MPIVIVCTACHPNQVTISHDAGKPQHPDHKTVAPITKPQIEIDRLTGARLDGSGFSKARLLRLDVGSLTSAPSLLLASNSPHGQSFQVSPRTANSLRVGHAPPEYPISRVSQETFIEHLTTPRLNLFHSHVHILHPRNTSRHKVRRSTPARRV